MSEGTIHEITGNDTNDGLASWGWVLMQFENTTNRGWWIIQAQPTRKGAGRPSNPTNRGWWIRSYPAYDHSGTR